MLYGTLAQAGVLVERTKEGFPNLEDEEAGAEGDEDLSLGHHGSDLLTDHCL